MRLLLFITLLFFTHNLHDDGVVESMETIIKPEKPMVKISGHIRFEGEEPEHIPPGSWLSVTLQDVSLADAPSTDLGKYEAEIKEYKKNSPLMYAISMNNAVLPEDDENFGGDFSLTALISIGEKRGNIKKQDYLTMTMHSIDFKSNRFIYSDQDIVVEKYE